MGAPVIRTTVPTPRRLPPRAGSACPVHLARLLLASAVLGLAGCDPGDGGASGDARAAPPGSSPGVVDDRGHLHVPEQPPRRVVSVVPAVTELVAAIGARDRLVARTRYDRAAALSHLPSIGDTERPNLEAIAALRPDLVVTWGEDEYAPASERIRALGIPVYHASLARLADLERHAHQLGRLLERQAETHALLHRIGSRLDSLRARRPRRPPSVLLVVWHDPPRTAGPGTFLHEILEVAGGRNLFGDLNAPWPVVSLEEVLRRDPDAVVVPAGSRAGAGEVEWLRSPGWRELSAVRLGRVLTVDPDLFHRPGPRVAEAAEDLAAFLDQVGSAVGDAAVIGSGVGGPR